MHIYSEYFLGLLTQIKLFHWSIKNYSAHVALDKLHSALSDNIDKFIEAYIGKYKLQPIPVFTINTTATSNCQNIIEYLQAQHDNIKKIRTGVNKASELQNIIDEMLANIDQSIYLLNLN
jgi:DNA-binding ferritin-like protein